MEEQTYLFSNLSYALVYKSVSIFYQLIAFVSDPKFKPFSFRVR